VFLGGCSSGWESISEDRGAVLQFDEGQVIWPMELQARIGKVTSASPATSDYQELIWQTGSTFYPVKLVKLRYRSADVQQNPLELSGLLILPVPIDPLAYLTYRPLHVPLLGLQHGTVLERDAAPSMNQNDAQVLVGMFVAAKGYAVAMADYPGLGVDSTGMHPYCHAESLATSVVDMLRASRRYLQERPMTRLVLDGQVFLMGYSEGGYATLSAVRQMRRDYPDEFNLVAACPMAGSYDLSGIMKERMLSREPYKEPYFLPYVILGYQAVYGDAITPAKLMKEPFATLIPPLMDGSHSIEAVDQVLPASRVIREMFKESVLADLENGTGPVCTFLCENDLYADWTPDVPLRFYHSPSDELVPYENSVKTVSEFARRGAPVELVELAPATHENAGVEAFLRAFLWIDSLR